MKSTPPLIVTAQMRARFRDIEIAEVMTADARRRGGSDPHSYDLEAVEANAYRREMYETYGRVGKKAKRMKGNRWTQS